MKNNQLVLLLFFLFSVAYSQAQEAIPFIETNRVVIDPNDPTYGYYLSVPPQSGTIKSVLVLLPGLGQRPKDIFLDTRLPEFAAQNNILTIGFSGGGRITADSLIQGKLTAILKHVTRQNNVDPNQFFFGGFSAGGVIALRYAELCNQYPDQFPVSPRAVFMADSPVDLFKSWDLTQENKKNNLSAVAVNEADWIAKLYRRYYGVTPTEDPQLFSTLSPFSIDPTLGENEIYLKEVAVRAYHDVDVSWRLIHRNQTARFDNYVATSELINRLMLLGNSKAEFIQTFQTGYRRNGERHPHSWSIIDAEECIQWLLSL